MLILFRSAILKPKTHRMLAISLLPRLLIFTLLIPVFAYAQMPQLYDSWRWARFGKEAGLSSEKILQLHESQNGEVWVYTAGGINRFDGFQWIPVKVPNIPVEGVHDLRISPDTAGILLSYDYMIYAVRRDTVVAIPVSDSRGPLATYATWREPGGSLVVRGDTALYRITGTNVSTLPSPFAPSQIRNVYPPVPANFIFPSDLGLWFKAGPALFRYESGNWENMYHSPGGFLRLHHLVENKAGSGMVILEPVTGDVRIFEWSRSGPLQELRGESGDLVQSLTVDPDGRFLLLYTSGELRFRHNGHWSWLPPLPPPVAQARFLKFGSRGDLWVGGDDGLFYCRISRDRWLNWKEPLPSLANMINEIVLARDGTFWIGTRDGIEIRKPDGQTQRIRELSGIPLGRVTAIGEDRDGHIWIGSGAAFAGAFCWNGRTWNHYGVKEGLAAPRIHRIAKDRRGRLWFLGLNTGRLVPGLVDEPGAFVLEDRTFIRWGKEEGLLDGRVYAFVEDAKGAYWFGTWSGLSRFHNGQWTYWQRDRGLRESRVWTLAVDSTDRVFFSHQFTGLGYFDAHDSVHYFGNADGLIGDQVWEVDVDQRGWVWVATSSGLGCWTGSEWFRFDSHAGLPNDKLWPILPMGREILVGTLGDGVAVLRLDSLNTVPPRVVIAEPVVEGDDASLSWTPHAYWGDLPAMGIKTRFRLSGTAWSTWSLQHAVTIRGLPAGTHQCEVQAESPLGQVRSQSAVRTFTIPPPLYLRPVVALPIVILLTLVITLALVGWLRRQSYNRTIRENEAKFRAQYKGNPIPTFTFRRLADDFVLNDCNDAAEVITLGNSREWLGKRFDEILPHASDAKDLLEECVRTSSTIRTDYSYQYQSVNRRVDLAVTFAFVPPDFVLVHTEDVTERKLSEEYLKQSREQLRALAARLQSVREEERTMLSREIHDELGQLMTGLKMDLAWIRRKVVDLGREIPDAVSQRMVQMNGLLDDAIQTVRKIAGQLRPAILDDLGLVPAIEWQARDFGDRTGIACEISLGTEEVQMERDKATELFRIYQELLTNVARHAHASRVNVTLHLEGEHVILEVRDNGRGIQEENVRLPSSLGILGMEERARRVNGTLTLVQGDEGGTVARVCVPRNPGGMV